jgi:D-tyrosyl-tRNA(Tyr) deacylase
LLVISQFTLYAQTKKGNRPSFIDAATPEIALPLYHDFLACLQQQYTGRIETGEFGADMQITLCNDGPITIIIDSKEKKSL